MKKIFIAMMAMAAFAACATEDTIVTPQGAAIAFGDAFVDNSTKAIYENGAVPTQFKVWGNVVGQNTVALYSNDGANVQGTGVGNVYTCEEVRYWTPSCTFNFAAIAHGTPKTVVNGLPTVISYTADGVSDLLYATASAETDSSGVPTGTIATIGQDKVVAFTFKHLLSRVAFKFTVASDLNEDYSYDVTDVEVAGAFATGECTPAGVWSEQDGTMADPLTFGDVTEVATAGSSAEGAYVIIPGTPTLTITFTAVCKLNGDTIKTYNYTKTVDAQEFLANHAYTFVAELPLPGKEIKFTVVNVDGFTTPANGDVTVE